MVQVVLVLEAYLASSQVSWEESKSYRTYVQKQELCQMIITTKPLLNLMQSLTGLFEWLELCLSLPLDSPGKLQDGRLLQVASFE